MNYGKSKLNILGKAMIKTTSFQEFYTDPRFLGLSDKVNKEYKLECYDSRCYLDTVSDDWTNACVKVAFDLHLLLTCTVENPYNLMHPSLLLGTFCMGTDAENAKIFERFNYIIERSPWFINFHNELEVQEARLGKTQFRWTPKHLTYDFANISIFCVRSSVSSLRGKTNFVAVVKEDIDLELRHMIELSLKTVNSKSRLLVEQNVIVPNGELITL